MVETLRFHGGRTGLIPGQGIGILHVAQPKKKGGGVKMVNCMLCIFYHNKEKDWFLKIA